MESQDQASHLKNKRLCQNEDVGNVPSPKMSPLEPCQFRQHGEQRSRCISCFALGNPTPEEVGRHAWETNVDVAVLITANAKWQPA
jgi:hypothetical protein